MEPITPGSNPAPIPEPAPISVPDPAPAPAPPPPAPPAPGPAKFGDGGKTGGFFSGISFTEVMMLGLTITGICFVIYYYKKRIDHLKSEKSIVQKKVEEIEVNVKDMKAAMGQEYKQL